MSEMDFENKFKLHEPIPSYELVDALFSSIHYYPLLVINDSSLVDMKNHIKRNLRRDIFETWSKWMDEQGLTEDFMLGAITFTDDTNYEDPLYPQGILTATASVYRKTEVFYAIRAENPMFHNYIMGIPYTSED